MLHFQIVFHDYLPFILPSTLSVLVGFYHGISISEVTLSPAEQMSLLLSLFINLSLRVDSDERRPD